MAETETILSVYMSLRASLARSVMSPYVYVESTDGERTWNADYEENGHYYDPIYGGNVVEFGVPAIAE